MISPVPFGLAENTTPKTCVEESRVLIHAPWSNDADVTAEVLRSEGITAQPIGDADTLSREIARGCALVIIAEEAMTGASPKITEILADQPAWSDLTILVVTSDGGLENRKQRLETLIRSANIMQIERPFRPETLLSFVQTALRARNRQYQVRDLLQRMQNGEMRVRQMLESISDAFLSIDPQWRIRFVNAAYMDLVSSLYHSPEELVGENLWEKFPDLKNNSTGAFYHRVMEQQRPETIEIYDTQIQRWLEIRAFPSTHYLSLYVRDVSPRREAEDQLRAAKENAEAASQAKDYFLAALSHELRTPLSPVMMISSMREHDASLPPHIQAEMAVIHRNVQLETKLIDDLLDLSSITSGKVRLSLQPVAFNAAVHQVCETCRELATAQGVAVRCHFDETAGQAEADPARLQQILWNVLKNAIKFSPHGGEVSVTTIRVSSSLLRCTITDSGTGIDRDLLPKIFDAFEQGESRKTQQFGGLGLGLAISRALVDLHKGRIEAASEGAGRGSTFTIDLPASSEEAAPQTQGSPRENLSESIRVLLVEDHADTAMILKRQLEVSGFVVQTANSGAAALEAAETFDFDILLSDLGLPDITGYDLIGELRKTRHFSGIAMSGYGMEEDLQRSAQAGFAKHLVKPVSLDAVQSAILSLRQS